MSDHTLVLFNVFEDWNVDSVVPHISFVSFVINHWLLYAGFDSYSIGPSLNVLSSTYGRFDLNANVQFAGPYHFLRVSFCIFGCIFLFVWVQLSIPVQVIAWMTHLWDNLLCVKCYVKFYSLTLYTLFVMAVVVLLADVCLFCYCVICILRLN